jgi:chaperonin GroEL
MISRANCTKSPKNIFRVLHCGKQEGKGDFGFNARTDTYENLYAAGVIDPTKVARIALENAASVAGMFLTTECVLVEKKEENPPMAAPGGMGGMGGMM